MTSEFKFEVSRAELVKHLEARVTHHRERSSFYREKAVSLRETTERYMASDGKDVILPQEILSEIAVEPNYGRYSMGNFADRAIGVQRNAAAAQDAIKAQVVEQVERLTAQHEHAAERHANKADTLAFYASHLPSGASKFDVSYHDLARFELLPTPAGMGVGAYVDVEESF